MDIAVNKIQNIYQKHKQLQHLDNDNSYECPIPYDNNLLGFLHFQCIQHHPTISVRNRPELPSLEVLLLHSHIQADDMQPWHHLNSNNHDRLFPTPRCGTRPNGQCHSHSMALVVLA